MTQSSEVFSSSSPSASIPLPSGGPKNAAEIPSSRRLALVLIFLVTVLAFLLASFPARKSDVWLHLARGRLLAQGAFPSATDSDLAFDLSGNQTWLYDLLCYSCYRILDGMGLVLGKALLAAGIALLLLRQSRVGSGWCVSALCTSLALLTTSLYLMLQPATVSYLFLALLLAFLGVPRTDENDASSQRLSWPLLLLFVLWANLDRWFLLGLGVAALVWAGEVLDSAFADKTSSRRWQAVLLRRSFTLIVLAAACLLNPSHLRAFVLAEEVAPFGASAGQVMSPFKGAYLAKVGWGPASLAYFVLLGLSLISFVAVLPRWRWRRFLPWLGLALLSAGDAPAIPFFAVVAGPVLAWNVQDALGRLLRLRDGSARDGQDPSLTLPARTGAALTVTLMLLLVVCAWPGWLQTPPFGPRSWAFDLPPSLERGAAAVRRWHEEGKLPADSGGLHLSAETIGAFAWFCPAEKRLLLTEEGSAADWRQRMRSAGINYILVYYANRERLFAALGGLVTDPEQWPLLYQEGDLAIFGWRDPSSPLIPPERGGKGGADLFRDWQLDLNKLAFHPAQDKKAPPEAADPQARERSWWEAFWKATPPRSIDRDEALMHLLHAEALQRDAPLRHLSSWENSQAAALVGAAGAWASPSALSDAHLRLVLFRPRSPDVDPRAERPSSLDLMALRRRKDYMLRQDDAPPALYYLAVRAARRALTANPEDAPAYLLLGESYLGFLHATRERAWRAQLPRLAQLRQAQASAALNRALALRPHFLQAHLHLGRLYQEMGYLDLALQHLQAYCRLEREAGPSRGVGRKEFLDRLAHNEEGVARLEREVEKRENAFTLGSADSPTRDKAFLAFQNGLAGKALELLLGSHLSAFGNEGMELELELLLGAGRARDVQEWLTPEYVKALDPLTYHWFRIRALTALGDYTRAEEECDEASSALAQLPDSREPLHPRENMALMIAKLVLDEQMSTASFARLLVQIKQAASGPSLQMCAQRLRQRAELTALHGLLALEEGEIEEAKFAFTAALDLWKDKSTAASGGSLDFYGRAIAQASLRWLE